MKAKDLKSFFEQVLTLDAGPPVHINGILLNKKNLKKYADEFKKGSSSNYRVEYRGTSGWAICNNRSCLNKVTEAWEYEGLPSGRTEKFIEECRFPTITDCFDYLSKWRLRERKRFLKEIACQKELFHLEKLHEQSFINKPLLEEAKDCVCFHCKKSFHVRKIKEWTKEKEKGQTAICPYCSVDSVIPSKNVNQDTINKLYKKYFEV